KAVPWRLRFLVAIVATLALVATACGNDDDSDSGDSTPPAPAATGTAADSDDGLSDEEVEIRVAYFNGAGQTEIEGLPGASSLRVQRRASQRDGEHGAGL
ncbi:MAG: hypothetical protein OXF64_05705, partial [bacterium]|nr:hypothetical protein [bacterium]